MARSSAVTVNFLADTTPLKRGVRSINRSLKSVGRGANLQGVSRDISKMNRGIGSLVGGLGQLRMGWFGVGAAASGALVGAAAAVQRIGNEWDRAIVELQRSTGVVVGNVDGMEQAFQKLAGSVPDNFETIAQVYGTVMTDMVNETESAGQEITRVTVENAAHVAEIWADTARSIRIDPNQVADLLAPTTTGVAGAVGGADLLAYLSQQVPGLNLQQLSSDFSRQRGIFPYGGDVGLLPMASLQLHAGDPGLVTAFREAMDRSGLSPEAFGVMFDELAQLAASRRPDDIAAQRELFKSLIRAPSQEGGLGVTTELTKIARSVFPESGLLPLRLSEAGLAPMLEAAEGARFRGSQPTASESWAETWNFVNATVGPSAREIIINNAEKVGGTARVFTHQSFWAGVGATGLEIMSLGEAETLYDIDEQRQMAIDAITELKKRGKFDIDKIADPEVRRAFEVDAINMGFNILRQIPDAIDRANQEAGGGDAGRQAQVELLANWMEQYGGEHFEIKLQTELDKEADKFGNTVGEAGHTFKTEVEGAARNLALRLAEDAKRNREALLGERLRLRQLEMSPDYVPADAAILGEYGLGRFDFKQASESDIGAFGGFTGYGPVEEFEDLGRAARGAAQSLYDLEDGMHILADGVIFREAEILSQATDPDGITSYTTGVGGIVPKTPNRASTASTSVVSDGDKWPRGALV